MKIGDQEVSFLLNVKNTKARYISLLMDWIKKEETRTDLAWKLMSKYLFPGMTIGIVENGMIIGLMRFDGIHPYMSAYDFSSNRSLHCVPEGSEYDWKEGKGKIGLRLSSPIRLASPVRAPESKYRGFRLV